VWLDSCSNSFHNLLVLNVYFLTEISRVYVNQRLPRKSYQGTVIFHETFQITQPKPNKEKVLFLA
jgi:hypothetical protein